MTIAKGHRLGPYEVVSRLGAGGMGEVWRARDGKLGREVAIKVLPEAFASDAERLARFRREAQVLASLNHPHVAAIYGIEEAGGVEALVLELVEGETLAERIARGPLPMDEVLEIARQIADALEAAHERGIVHRDLKPANVKLTPDGKVKVLDFGLAKALSPDRSSPDVSHSPTVTAASTQAGVVIGTAAYMSPEQARGRSVDKRADIWAFGTILWEMLTGRRLFEGDTVSDVLAAVLRENVDFGALPHGTPDGIVRLLHRCLERDPRNRLHDVADARLEIEEALRTPARRSAGADPAAPASRVRRLLPWSVAAAAAAVAVAAVVLSLASTRQGPPSTDEVVRLSIALPENLAIDSSMGDQAQILAISRDGRRIAFRGRIGDDHRIFVRDLARETPNPVTGTEGAAEPFFSPDGEWLGFVSGEKLKKASLRGGTPIVLATAARSRGAAWAEDGTIVFSPTVNSPLFRVPAAGGEARALTTLDRAGRERSHRWPEPVPEGGWVLFTVGTEDKPGDYDDARIDAVSLSTGRRHVVFRGASLARYMPPDRLLLTRHGDLLAAPFDPKAGEVRGAAVPVLQGVSGDTRSGVSYFGVSATGTLTWVAGLAEGNQEIVSFDRSGRVEPTGIPAGQISSVALSPDGRSLAYCVGPGGGARTDVWIADLAHSGRFQLTFTGQAAAPGWTPDGKSVVYSTPTGDAVMRQRADGSAPPEVVWKSPYRVPMSTDSFLPDGSAVVISLYGRPTFADIFLVPLTGGAARPLIETPAAEYQARVSPDGKWIAYTGEYEGVAQVYVQPYPSLAGRWQISRKGGAAPRWSADGTELYYVWNDEILAVPIRQSPFAPGDPHPLFRIERPAPIERLALFDSTPDGKRFVAIVRQKDSTQAPGVNVALHFGRLAAGTAP